MNNLYENIKNKTLKVGDVYANAEGHHVTITEVLFYQDVYKEYLLLNKLIRSVFKLVPISKALNWTFTIKYQGRITYTNSEEIRGICSSSIVAVDYDESSYKKFKDFEKYIITDVEFPSTPLIKKKK